MSNDQEEDIELEGDYISDPSERLSAPRLKNNKGDARDLNVTKRVCELGHNPIDVLVAIASNDRESLGMTPEENVRVHDRKVAAEVLLSYIAPKMKAVEPEEDFEKIKPLPIFAPQRGVESRKDRERIEYDNGEDD